MAEETDADFEFTDSDGCNALHYLVRNQRIINVSSFLKDSIWSSTVEWSSTFFEWSIYSSLVDVNQTYRRLRLYSTKCPLTTLTVVWVILVPNLQLVKYK